MDFSDRIEKEFADARESRRQGKEGRARVCARRAAGYAVAWLITSRGEQVRENDSLRLLKTLQAEESFPPTVHEASKRLTARITSDFRYPFPTDPIDDARIIVDHIKNLLV